MEGLIFGILRHFTENSRSSVVGCHGRMYCIVNSPFSHRP